MKILRPGGDPAAFFARLAGAPARVLLLDYDGTLAPFRERRDEALPYPAARDSVRDIQADGRTRVIVISGRAVVDLTPLLGLEPAPELWGSHGWERLRSGEAVERGDPGEAVAVLEDAARLVEALVPPERLERKPASLAVHMRGLAAADADRLVGGVLSLWAPHLERPTLAVHVFDGGIELRVSGRDKGTAVREILSEEPADAAIAYLGDDLTDEDAFRAMGSRGLSVLVRDELRDTAADLWIRPPEELVDFLHGWREAARTAAPATAHP